jgi:serine/threonine protein kinase
VAEQVDDRDEQGVDDLIGMTLGHCVIEELIGQGGMARVYRAYQSNLDRHIAVKVLPPYYAADPAFVERFKIESRAMARLTHPNILVVHDAGREQGHLYITMEYIGGGNLKDYMESKPFAFADIPRIIHDLAAALSYAHAQGIVHRDVKPVNVLMDVKRQLDGAGHETVTRRVVLSDFGIAKMVASSNVITHTGAGVGTPEYMSPEQCRGTMVDARSDIYALGVMLYEMLTGHTPFEADNYTALAHSHIYEPAPLPSRLNPRISPAVQAVVMKALEKDPSERFQQATEMALALDQAMAAQMPLPNPSARVTAGRAPNTLPCPNCGAANAAQQRYCTSCGAPLYSGAVAVPRTQTSTDMSTGGPEAWVACPNCQQRNRALDRFCTSCGRSLLSGVPGRNCAKCGTRNPAGTRYCTGCGAAMG